MNLPVDTFAAFVAMLTQALDDHEATGADLAGRVHLSRSHLDRVVAGVSGERPAGFRRRVLLERAAYRLLISQDSILDIAVEAGYTSHEAFTRAFSRAYGVAPASWRRHPTRLQIEAPSGVHFHPPGGLRLPAREKVSSVDLVRRMFDHHVWLLGEMLTRAATLDDERLDAPIELSVEGIDDQPTLRSLLSRLVGQLAMWSAAIEGVDYDFAVEHGETVKSMQTRLAEAGPAFALQVAGICEQERLDEMLICPGESVEVYSYGGMIAHVLTFAAHRRTLVAGALHDAGFTDLDAGDPIRWLTEAT